MLATTHGLDFFHHGILFIEHVLQRVFVVVGHELIVGNLGHVLLSASPAFVVSSDPGHHGIALALLFQKGLERFVLGEVRSLAYVVPLVIRKNRGRKNGDHVKVARIHVQQVDEQRGFSAALGCNDSHGELMLGKDLPEGHRRMMGVHGYGNGSDIEGPRLGGGGTFPRARTRDGPLASCLCPAWAECRWTHRRRGG